MFGPGRRPFIYPKWQHGDRIARGRGARHVDLVHAQLAQTPGAQVSCIADCAADDFAFVVNHVTKQSERHVLVATWPDHSDGAARSDIDRNAVVAISA